MYRFCVAVTKDEFPIDDEEDIPNHFSTIAQSLSSSKRANLVTLKSPLVIVNLLPLELEFVIENKNINGRIMAGQDFPVNSVSSLCRYNTKKQTLLMEGNF